jgi:hypothetical protein
MQFLKTIASAQIAGVRLKISYFVRKLQRRQNARKLIFCNFGPPYLAKFWDIFFSELNAT